VFDSIVQRDAPEAARGRAFARFETRFQIVWVVGGVFAVLFPGKERGGLFLLALVLLFAGLSYIGTTRRAVALLDGTGPDGTGADAFRAPRPRADTEADSGRAARRHLRARIRARRVPPAPAAGPDDPPDAFPAGS
jgi:hypothetical protein